MRRVFLCVVLVMSTSTWAFAQRDWNAPFPAHRVIDNIYFVGTEALGTFLITTSAGHILINTDFESTVPSIRRSVEELGFAFDDIRIILGSHAHGDHMQADALVKELTGGQVMVMREDVEQLRAMRPGGGVSPASWSCLSARRSTRRAIGASMPCLAPAPWTRPAGSPRSGSIPACRR